MSLSLLGLLRKKNLMDVRQDTALGDSNRIKELVELLVVADGELQVPGDDPPLLVVSGSVPSQLEDLRSEVLEDGCQVDRRPCPHPPRVVPVPQQPVHPSHWELQPCLLWARFHSSWFLLLWCRFPSFSSGHFSSLFACGVGFTLVLWTFRWDYFWLIAWSNKWGRRDLRYLYYSWVINLTFGKGTSRKRSRDFEREFVWEKGRYPWVRSLFLKSVSIFSRFGKMFFEKSPPFFVFVFVFVFYFGNLIVASFFTCLNYKGVMETRCISKIRVKQTF